MTKSNKSVFEEACNGYGFEEVPQYVDGVYCTGCCFVHNNPEN